MARADAVMAIYLGSIILASIGGIAATLCAVWLTSYALIHLSFGGNAARPRQPCIRPESGGLVWCKRGLIFRGSARPHTAQRNQCFPDSHD